VTQQGLPAQTAPDGGDRGPRAAASCSELDTIRAALAACRAAFDRWSVRADNDLTVYLDAALTALAAGFAPTAIPAVG
jgi:hypothetical protein